ncbi:D-lyxose ketol-isomerase [Hydrogenispora ethanolica]|uniref:D-lyxose ketol-isomerase n=1 Tax=Hydrogenispora ethanolica TaxID=1082276 RepID=A0A4V2QGA7_HYDET|nr:D-lyxose/D-mannose family sugar isomerase [Hydrogenispora ethanolica]TCL75107.1 D-lyxose ketol-isomerase [Hydrogenispora ethanolica]
MSLTKQQWEKAQQRALALFEKAAIVLTDREKEHLEVADFGLEDLDRFGLEIVTYVNTDRCCAKELVLFPGQTCPEHRHPPVAGEPGKEETFRCRYGLVYLYVAGPATPEPEIKATLPAGREQYFTARHQIILHPGDQYTLAPDTWHWFQAGPEGAVVSEFSTKSRDEADLWSDPQIQRIPEIR